MNNFSKVENYITEKHCKIFSENKKCILNLMLVNKHNKDDKVFTPIIMIIYLLIIVIITIWNLQNYMY